MKRIITVPLIAMLMACLLFPFVPAKANNNNSDNTYTVSVQKKPKNPKSNEDLDCEGHRAPSRSIVCVISPEGIYIPGISTEEILSYEVAIPEGECVASFVEDQDFISFIYTLNGAYEIRLHTEGYIFHGYIDL